jgi:hypothetical protein
MMLRTFSLILLLSGLSTAVRPAHAAQAYDNCAGYIDSLPATISTQGVWCLRKDLATGMTSGFAIEIQTNNVTIDCNDFKIGGMTAGDGSNAIGIHASNRQNITVRHCALRGFNKGIVLDGSGGHLVEDNRLDNILFMGMVVNGNHNRVRRNVVYDTGGATGNSDAYGIAAQGDITDNIVDGVSATATNTNPVGIRAGFDASAHGTGALIARNRVGGLEVAGTGSEIAIKVVDASASGLRIEGNHLVGALSGAALVGNGISGQNAAYCIDNSIGGFATNTVGCQIDSGTTGN